MTDRVAYIVDGAFFVKNFKSIYKKFPSAENVETYIHSIQEYIKDHSYLLKNSEIYRIFFYDCKPLKETLTNPVDNSSFDLSQSQLRKDNEALQDSLKKKHYFALRFGELKLAGHDNPWNQWKVRDGSLSKLKNKEREMSPKDLTPNISQKGVDIKMGLDIASMTSKKLCTKIVLLSGDTDMISAMKLARKEGVHVFLHVFQKAHHAMATHSDIILAHNKLNFTPTDGGFKRHQYGPRWAGLTHLHLGLYIYQGHPPQNRRVSH